MSRASAGFSFIETMVSLFIAGIVLMVVASLYAFTARAHTAQLPSLPFVAARSALSTIVRDQVLSADCLLEPAAPATGEAGSDTLKGKTGETCAGEALNGPVRYFAVCLHGASKRVLYRTSGAPITGACGAGGAASRWTGLTPPMLEASGLAGGAVFSRSAAQRNLITAKLRLDWQAGNARSQASQTWEATMAAPGALRPD